MKRFWDKVDIKGVDDCWLWQASGDDYGMFWWEGNFTTAHRVAFFLTHDFWPQVVRHTCDVRRCCNPSHLMAGDYSSNALDAVRRGRWARQDGEFNPVAKLTYAQAEEIRQKHAEGTSQRQLGMQYGISSTQVHMIVHGKAYRGTQEVRPGAKV